MISTFINWLDETVEPVEDFILAHGTNPILWVALFLGGLLIFTIVYGALNKNG